MGLQAHRTGHPGNKGPRGPEPPWVTRGLEAPNHPVYYGACRHLNPLCTTVHAGTSTHPHGVRCPHPGVPAPPPPWCTPPLPTLPGTPRYHPTSVPVSGACRAACSGQGGWVGQACCGVCCGLGRARGVWVYVRAVCRPHSPVNRDPSMPAVARRCTPKNNLE